MASLGPENKLPEERPDITYGVLPDLWNSGQPLPKIKGIELLGYYLQQGVRCAIALPLSSFVAVLTVTISAFFFGGFLLLLSNAEHAVEQIGTNLSFVLYLKDDVSESQATEFTKVLGVREDISASHYTSKAEAGQLFRKELGGNGKVFYENLDLETILPASVEVDFKRDLPDLRARLQQFSEKMKAHPFVSEVVYGSDWLERVESILALIRVVGVVLTIIVFLGVAFLFASIMRLVVYARKTEIEIMQLVGADDMTIRLPFLIAGALQGIIGAALGLILLLLSFYFFHQAVEGSQLLGVVISAPSYLSSVTAISFILGGAVLGSLASVIALGRHLDV